MATACLRILISCRFLLTIDYQSTLRYVIIEIKARCTEPSAVRARLAERFARFVGTDRQCDTYFVVNAGRLKLREGDIENALIFYDRADRHGPKQSNVTLYRPEQASPLKEMLTCAMGIDVVVRKTREIYFVDNVKFHIDVVDGLGTFVEIEAIDDDGTIGPDELRRQCDEYVDLFAITPDDLLSTSYSDMLRSASTGT